MRRIQLRQTHPNLFRGSMTIACTFIALGLNYVFFHPTFDQYGLAGAMSGLFALFGTLQFYALVTRRLPTLRASQAAVFIVTLFWAGALTLFTFTTHKTSLQLPIAYLGLAALQMTQLIEPAANPLNARADDGDRPG